MEKRIRRPETGSRDVAGIAPASDKTIRDEQDVASAAVGYVVVAALLFNGSLAPCCSTDSALEPVMPAGHGAALAHSDLQHLARSAGLWREVLQPLLNVDPDYIGAAMAVIDERYGGMQHYLADVLHVDL